MLTTSILSAKYNQKIKQFKNYQTQYCSNHVNLVIRNFYYITSYYINEEMIVKNSGLLMIHLFESSCVPNGPNKWCSATLFFIN